MRTPTVLQMEAVECGAASLAILLGYYGRILPLEALRVACDVSRDGTKASNILQAARSYGLKGKGFRKTAESVKDMKFPVIIHWNFNHFLVLEGFHKGRAYLSDPAQGRYSVSSVEFDEAFTGVVLAFETGPDFRKSREKPGLLTSLVPRLANSRGALTFVLLASLGLVIPGLVVPSFTRVFIDQFLVKNMADWVPPLLLVMFLIMALNAALTWLQQRYLLRLETKMALSTSSHFLWHILHLPVEFFTQRFGGEIGSRVRINDRVAQLLSGDLATTLLSVVTIVFYLGLMFFYDGLLTLISLGMALLNVAGLLAVNRQRKEASVRLLQERSKLMGTTMNGLKMIETLKSSGGESDYYTRWSGYFAKMINAEQILGFSSRTMGVLPSLLMALNTAAILSIGSLRIMEGHLTIGTLIAFQYLMANFILPVNRLVQVGTLLQTAEADMNRLDDVLRYRRDPGLEANEVVSVNGTPKLVGALELKEVTFGYSRLSPPLIERFNLKLAPGSRVALVGGSGSGKSTIARLVCDLYRPSDGEILFDGQPRARLARSVLNNSLALVDQDILLFEDTIRANLSLWNTTIPDAHLIRAAKDACIHDDIAARKGGYDGMVREGGRNFSGGQRQRLEIARALAQNPSILVLDEATSALDATTEKQVMDSLRRRGCTCMIVAHRLSTIRDCDEIIVMQAGQVVQRGTHEALVREGGHYMTLISSE